jgi:3-methyl-2-oxobutanoate hydroxymethyltransferase
VADLPAIKGRRQLTMLDVETVDEAAAAAAGIDMLSIIQPVWMPARRSASDGELQTFLAALEEAA